MPANCSTCRNISCVIFTSKKAFWMGKTRIQERAIYVYCLFLLQATGTNEQRRTNGLDHENEQAVLFVLQMNNMVRRQNWRPYNNIKMQYQYHFFFFK